MALERYQAPAVMTKPELERLVKDLYARIDELEAENRRLKAQLQPAPDIKHVDRFTGNITDAQKRVVLEALLKKRIITSADVREAIFSVSEGKDPRVVGAVLRRMSQEGLIGSTGHVWDDRAQHQVVQWTLTSQGLNLAQRRS